MIVCGKRDSEGRCTNSFLFYFFDSFCSLSSFMPGSIFILKIFPLLRSLHVYAAWLDGLRLLLLYWTDACGFGWLWPAYMTRDDIESMLKKRSATIKHQNKTESDFFSRSFRRYELRREGGMERLALMTCFCEHCVWL